MKLNFINHCGALVKNMEKRRVPFTAKRVTIVFDFTGAEANGVPKKLTTKYTRFGKTPESFCEMLKELRIVFTPLVVVFYIINQNIILFF